MAHSPDQPTSGHEQTSNWGDDAEQHRRSRLEQLEAFQIEFKVEDDDLRTSEGYPSKDALDPALGPESSGANNAPLGSRCHEADRFLSSLGNTLAHSCPVSPRRSDQGIPAEAFKSTNSLPQNSVHENVLLNSTNYVSESSWGWQNNGQNDQSIFGKENHRESDEAVRIKTECQRQKALRKRVAKKLRVSLEKQRLERNRLRTTTSVPSHGSRLSLTNSTVDSASVQSLFAAAPPDICQTCNVNIADIERTTAFQFPTTCPVCHHARWLLPLNPHQQAAAATERAQGVRELSALQKRTLPGVQPTALPYSRRPYHDDGRLTPTEHGVPPYQSRQRIRSSPAYFSSANDSLGISGRWMHDKYDRVKGKDRPPRRCEPATGMTERPGQIEQRTVKKEPLEGDDLKSIAEHPSVEESVPAKKPLGLDNPTSTAKHSSAEETVPVKSEHYLGKDLLLEKARAESGNSAEAEDGEIREA